MLLIVGWSSFSNSATNTAPSMWNAMLTCRIATIEHAATTLVEVTAAWICAYLHTKVKFRVGFQCKQNHIANVPKRGQIKTRRSGDFRVPIAARI